MKVGKKADRMAARRSWEEKMGEVGDELQPRKKDAVDLLTFDFQQDLATPNLTHHAMCYVRQMWTRLPKQQGVHDCVV